MDMVAMCIDPMFGDWRSRRQKTQEEDYKEEQEEGLLMVVLFLQG